MDDNKYEGLKLENNMGFPLYVCSKEIIRKYTAYLSELDLTFTQYLTMMVLWENKCMSVKALGEYLYLDSGTLTPLLKKLEAKGYITRKRAKEDERSLDVTITDDGLRLREKAITVPGRVDGYTKLTQEEAKTLYDLLYKILDNIK
ncbi:MAG: MarR family transcriptional regulator [Lachnospiraceae bacterium]|nr:MarR family transcriptional regulator [Lachnospiraceae bacterium]